MLPVLKGRMKACVGVANRHDGSSVPRNRPPNVGDVRPDEDVACAWRTATRAASAEVAVGAECNRERCSSRLWDVYDCERRSAPLRGRCEHPGVRGRAPLKGRCEHPGVGVAVSLQSTHRSSFKEKYRKCQRKCVPISGLGPRCIRVHLCGYDVRVCDVLVHAKSITAR
jgi:hypothetical protein